MNNEKALEKKVLSLGGKLQTDDKLGIAVTFYHKNFSEHELDILENIKGISVLAFYVCDIESKDIEKISKIKNIEKLGFYSCPNITDLALKLLDSLPNLKTIVFTDTPVSNKAIAEYKENYPEIEIRGPAHDNQYH